MPASASNQSLFLKHLPIALEAPATVSSSLPVALAEIQTRRKEAETLRLRVRQQMVSALLHQCTHLRCKLWPGRSQPRPNKPRDERFQEYQPLLCTFCGEWSYSTLLSMNDTCCVRSIRHVMHCFTPCLIV
jgi:hypothetical protein